MSHAPAVCNEGPVGRKQKTLYKTNVIRSPEQTFSLRLQYNSVYVGSSWGTSGRLPGGASRRADVREGARSGRLWSDGRRGIDHHRGTVRDAERKLHSCEKMKREISTKTNLRFIFLFLFYSRGTKPFEVEPIFDIKCFKVFHCLLSLWQGKGIEPDIRGGLPPKLLSANVDFDQSQFDTAREKMKACLPMTASRVGFKGAAGASPPAL